MNLRVDLRSRKAVRGISFHLIKSGKVKNENVSKGAALLWVKLRKVELAYLI